MSYADYARMMIDLSMSLRNRVRVRSSEFGIDEAAELSMQIEKFRFFLTQSRGLADYLDASIAPRVEQAALQILENKLFQRELAHKRMGRMTSARPSNVRQPVLDVLSEDASYSDALYIFLEQLQTSPAQTTLDFNSEARIKVQRLRDLVPEQKIAPAQFEFRNDKLVVVQQSNSTNEEDRRNTEVARSTLIEQGERLLKNFVGANSDPRLIPRPAEIDSRDSVLGQIMIQHGGRRFRHGNSPHYPSGLHG